MISIISLPGVIIIIHYIIISIISLSMWLKQCHKPSPVIIIDRQFIRFFYHISLLYHYHITIISLLYHYYITIISLSYHYYITIISLLYISLLYHYHHYQLFVGKSSYKWSCSIAMLVYQAGYDLYHITHLPRTREECLMRLREKAAESMGRRPKDLTDARFEKMSAVNCREISPGKTCEKNGTNIWKMMISPVNIWKKNVV